MPTFCTIITPTTVAAARVMAASVRRHHPGSRVVAALARGVTLDTDEPFQPLERRGNWSVPELLREVLTDGELAVFLHPTTFVCGALEPVLAAAEARGVAVAPRVVALPDDRERPDAADLVAAGSVSDGLVAIRAGEAASEFLDWWGRGLREAEGRGPQGDDAGRWLELAAQRFDAVAIVADPGCEVSFWNLHERVLERNGQGIRAGGQPLRSLRFEGFRPDRPYWLSDDATRPSVVDDPVLADLCGEYAELLRAAGWTSPRPQIAGLRRLGNGQRVDRFVSELWEDAFASGLRFGDPRAAEAADEFCAWLREPARRGARSGVTRYLLAVYLARPDLQEAFPNLDGEDGDPLVGWSWDHAGDDLRGELIAPAPEGVAPAVNARIAVNVIGYLGETLGLAEAARLYITALSAARVPVSTTSITPDLPIEDSQRDLVRYGSKEWTDLPATVPAAFNLACLNGDHLGQLIRDRGEEVLEGRSTIGQWGWETDVLPPSWAESYDHVREVWVYSTFMAQNLGRLLPMPVVVVPPAIVTPDASAAQLDFARDDRFTFISMLDFFSTLERKNPLGLIDAFMRAFLPNEGPRLLIKTINAHFRPESSEELRFRARGRPDIEFVDVYLEPEQRAALMRRADCYVSLHRSEGFGLPLAEAMAAGTPVIATGYSGNLDFMTRFNSYLVNWTPTHVGPDSGVYPADGRWAEPDLEHGAAQMRRVYERREEAHERAQRAMSDIRRLYAPAVVGEIARDRLELLADARATARAPGPVLALRELDRLEFALTYDPRHGPGPPPRGAKGLLRRIVLRLMLPFTHHQRELDRMIVNALRELSAAIETTVADGHEARHRGGQLEAPPDPSPGGEPRR
ncbi:MAG: glycosyltransferase [Solirubrobacteraceae bacterium]